MAGIKGKSGGARRGAGRKSNGWHAEIKSREDKIKRRKANQYAPPRVTETVGGAREGPGRKAFAPTSAQRNIVEKAAAFGLTHNQICLLIQKSNGEPIERTTLTKYFQAELGAGKPKAIATVAGALYNNAVARNNVTAQMYFLSRVAKWTDAPATTIVDQHVTVDVEAHAAAEEILAELDRRRA